MDFYLKRLLEISPGTSPINQEYCPLIYFQMGEVLCFGAVSDMSGISTGEAFPFILVRRVILFVMYVTNAFKFTFQQLVFISRTQPRMLRDLDVTGFSFRFYDDDKMSYKYILSISYPWMTSLTHTSPHITKKIRKVTEGTKLHLRHSLDRIY